MKLLFKLAFRELYNNRKFSLFFISTLFVGLIGFALLSNLQSSINHYMNQYAKSILAADVKFSTNFKLTEKESNWLNKQLPKGTKQARMISFFAMARAKDKAKLVSVKAIDNGYPLYGRFTFKTNNKTTTKSLNTHVATWAQAELLRLLNVKQGDSIQLGDAQFQVQEQVKDAPGLSFWNANIGYQLYIGLDQVDKTGLLQKGSRQSFAYFFLFPPQIDSAKLSEKISSDFEAEFPNHSFQMTHYSNANKRIGGILLTLTRYLALLALVALFLAGIGIAYLFQAYLSERKKELAIVISLGFTKLQAISILIIQIITLSLIASLLAVFVSFALLPFALSRLAYFLPNGFHFINSPSVLLITLLISVSSSFAFTFPLFYQLKSNPILSLFQSISITKKNRLNLPLILSYVPLLLFYEVVSVVQVNSFYIGSLFTGSLVISIIMFAFIAIGITYLLSLWKKRPLTVTFILRRWQRNKATFLAIFISLATGSLLLNFMPLLATGITQELQRPDSLDMPSFFLFDIQKEEKQDLENWLRTQDLTLANEAAMIPAKLQAVNNKSLSKLRLKKAVTKKEKDKKRIATRDYWLSERANLYKSETVTKGTWFTDKKTENELPQISIDRYFAKQMNVALGDKLTFTIDGLPVTGKIKNFRQIRWNSFEPNFFVLFQPPTLTHAPGSYLGTLNHVPENKKLNLQLALAKKFPTISILDVSFVLKKILALLTSILLAVNSMAYISIFVGLLIVYTITFYETAQRKQEANLLKVLGANVHHIYTYYLVEFTFLGFICASIGLVLSFILSYVVAKLFFIHVTPSFSLTLWSNIGIMTCISTFTALFSMYKVMRSQPSSLFSEFSALSS